MQQIVIEVDDATAVAFGKFSPETKSLFNEAVAITLKKMINDATINEHMRFLDEFSDKAQKNGLTKEILNDLLKADD
ncbi:MAG: hypothetical protein ACTHOB_04635 [Ginsengibacter sp.]